MTLVVMPVSGETGGGRRAARLSTGTMHPLTARDGRERQLAERLAQLESSSIRVFLDVTAPGASGAHHLVVTAGGVWSIAVAPTGEGRPERMLIPRPLRRSAERLRIGNRDRTDLIDTVTQRVAALRTVTGDAPVRGALCLLGGDWPLSVGPLRVGGVDVLWPRRLVERIREDAQGEVDVDAVARMLSAAVRRA